MHGLSTIWRTNREQVLREENSSLRKEAREARRAGALAAYDTVLAFLDNDPPTLASTKEHVRNLRADVNSTI